MPRSRTDGELSDRYTSANSSFSADHGTRLAEAVVVKAVNGWLHELSHPDNRDRTAAALLGSEGSPTGTGPLEAARNRLADAEARLQRYPTAIAAGVEPEALIDPINQAQAERAAAKAQIERVPADATVTRAEIYARIDASATSAGRWPTRPRLA
jgi:hypothetical protein